MSLTPTVPIISTVVYNRRELESIFLPIGQMLQIDRVSEVNDKQVVCEMDLDGHWVFPLHFPADGIFPASLLIEAAGQSVAVWCWHAGLRGRPRMTKVAAKFEGPVLPEDRMVTLVATVRLRRSVCLGKVTVATNGRTVAKIDSMIIILPRAEKHLAELQTLPS